MNILIIAIGSHGDVHPFLGIAQTLRSRGHKVKFIANGHYESLVRAVGIEFVQLGTAEEFLSVARDPAIWHWFKGFSRLAESIGQSIKPCYRAVVGHAHPGDTVLVYSTLAFGARMAQEHLSLPGVSVHLSPAIFASSHQPPTMKGLLLPSWLPRQFKKAFFSAFDWVVLDRLLGGALNSFRRELRLPPVRHVLSQWCHSPQRVIGLFPEWYAAAQPDWPQQTVLTGFPLYDETDVTPLSEEILRFLAAGSPPIAFTPGSAMLHGHKFFETAVEACRLMDRRAILLTRHREQIPEALAAHALYAPYAPFSQLLPHCAAVVHHGGIGSTSQGLATGVPQLLMPMSFDQPDNAKRIKTQGVGDALPPRRFTPDRVAAKLNKLITSAAVAGSCKRVAAKFSEEANPLEQTATWIEKL